jgi:hypothetical protein
MSKRVQIPFPLPHPGAFLQLNPLLNLASLNWSRASEDRQAMSVRPSAGNVTKSSTRAGIERITER